MSDIAIAVPARTVGWGTGAVWTGGACLWTRPVPAGRLDWDRRPRSDEVPTVGEGAEIVLEVPGCDSEISIAAMGNPENARPRIAMWLARHVRALRDAGFRGTLRAMWAPRADDRDVLWWHYGRPDVYLAAMIAASSAVRAFDRSVAFDVSFSCASPRGVHASSYLGQGPFYDRLWIDVLVPHAARRLDDVFGPDRRGTARQIADSARANGADLGLVVRIAPGVYDHALALVAPLVERVAESAGDLAAALFLLPDEETCTRLPAFLS